jgi:O-antigen ligase
MRSFDFVSHIWTTQPLFGVGTGNYRYHARPLGLGLRNDTPDNMYLLMLVESGIVSLCLRLSMLALVFATIRRGIGRARSEGDERKVDLLFAFSAYLGGMLVNMATWDLLYFPVTRSIFWLLAGLAMAFARMSAAEPRLRP